MSEGPTTKLCCLCGKDVTHAPRVKDPRGRYYCQACHQAAVRHKQAGASAAAVGAAKAASADHDLVTLADDPSPAPAPAAAPAPKTLPEFCPNCGAKVLPNRKFCVRCQRDVTQMDQLLAIRAEGEKEAKRQAAAATFGRVLRLSLWLLGVGIIAFGVYGAVMFFWPRGEWDGYPTTREGAIRTLLGHIAKGTDAEYDQAFYLVSFRARTTNNTNEIALYRNAFRKMHDDFVRKYGAAWLATVTIKNDGVNDGNPDEETVFLVTVGGEEYHISTQVQIALSDAIGNMATPRSRPVYDENGKNHFGVLSVEEYPAHVKSLPR